MRDIFFFFGLIIWAWTALCIGSIKYVWICSHCCTICNNSCSRYYVLSANSVELLRVSFSICVTYSVEWHFVPLCSVFWFISYEEWPPRLGSLFYSRVQRLKSALESSIKNLLLFNLTNYTTILHICYTNHFVLLLFYRLLLKGSNIEFLRYLWLIFRTMRNTPTERYVWELRMCKGGMCSRTSGWGSKLFTIISFCCNRTQVVFINTLCLVYLFGFSA